MYWRVVSRNDSDSSQGWSGPPWFLCAVRDRSDAPSPDSRTSESCRPGRLVLPRVARREGAGAVSNGGFSRRAARGLRRRSPVAPAIALYLLVFNDLGQRPTTHGSVRVR